MWLPSPLHTHFVNMTQLHKLAVRHQQRLPLPYISLAVVFSGIRELSPPLNMAAVKASSVCSKPFHLQ